jgi:hypothetical protein
MDVEKQRATQDTLVTFITNYKPPAKKKLKLVKNISQPSVSKDDAAEASKPKKIKRKLKLKV